MRAKYLSEQEVKERYKHGECNCFPVATTLSIFNKVTKNKEQAVICAISKKIIGTVPRGGYRWKTTTIH